MPLDQTHPAIVNRRRWQRDPPSEAEAATERLPAIKPLFFSTRGVAVGDQFEAWKEYCSPIAEIILPDGGSPNEGFIADHTAWNLNGMIVVKQSAPAHRYVRSAAKLRTSSTDHLYVAMIRNGRTWTEVDGHVAQNQPGAVQIGSLGHPFSGRSTACDSVVIYLPREMFERVPVTIGGMTGSILLGDSATLLQGVVDSIESRLHSLTAEDLPRIRKTLCQMIVACLDPDTVHETTAERMSGLMLMERTRRYVQNNLYDKDLSPAALARALGVSRTRLYKLLEPRGGVLHYIRRRRLHAAHVALGNPADKRHIIDIAHGLGFSSAGFSKSFSKEFGYSPRKARNATSSHGHSLRERYVAHGRYESFDDWLNQLCG